MSDVFCYFVVLWYCHANKLLLLTNAITENLVYTLCPDINVHIGGCNIHCIILHANCYVFFSSVACQRWTGPQVNTNYLYGRGNAATSLQACQQACAATAGCNGLDWVTTAAQGTQCWLSGTWSGARGSAANVNHYVYNRNCAGKKLFSLM